MELMHDLTYNNKSLGSLGFAITGKPFYATAQRKFSLASVSGKSGAVICDDGCYDNVSVSYSVNSLPHYVHSDSQQLVYEFIDWLSDFDGEYKLLTDTYNEGYFTYGICTNISRIANSLSKYLTANIEFSRVPFWYSYLGQKEITLKQSTTLTNPERYSSQPIIRIYPQSLHTDFTVNINDVPYEFTSGIPHSFIELDCERMTSAFKSVDLNEYCSFDYYPILKAGKNSITFDEAVSRIEIIPRWRRI